MNPFTAKDHLLTVVLQCAWACVCVCGVCLFVSVSVCAGVCV